MLRAGGCQGYMTLVVSCSGSVVVFHCLTVGFWFPERLEVACEWLRLWKLSPAANGSLFASCESVKERL